MTRHASHRSETALALSRKRMKWSTHAIVHKMYGYHPRATTHARSLELRRIFGLVCVCVRVSIYQYIIGVYIDVYILERRSEISTRSSPLCYRRAPLLAALASTFSKSERIVFRHNSPHVERSNDGLKETRKRMKGEVEYNAARYLNSFYLSREIFRSCKKKKLI